MHYDALILGNQPAGIQAALELAHAGYRVALIHPSLDCDSQSFGSVSGRTRGQHEIVYDLPEILLNQPLLLPTLKACQKQFAIFSEHLRQMWRVDREVQELRLRDHGVEVLQGTIEFLGPQRLRLQEPTGVSRELVATRMIVATGSEQRQSSGLIADGIRTVTPDQLLMLPEIPKRIVIVGAGMTGMAWTAVLSRLQYQVTVVDSQGEAIPAREALLNQHLQQASAGNYRLVTGHDAIGIDLDRRRELAVTLDCGVRVRGDLVLLAHGRRVPTENLGLKRLGVLPDESGRLWCNSELQTWEPSVQAIGQAISYPEPWRYAAASVERLVESFAGISKHAERAEERPAMESASAGVPRRRAKKTQPVTTTPSRR